MTKTTMYRKTRCSNCEYEQETFLSYYLDAKKWKANHDLEKCSAIRKEKKLALVFQKKCGTRLLVFGWRVCSL